MYKDEITGMDAVVKIFERKTNITEIEEVQHKICYHEDSTTSEFQRFSQ
jgi:hypothetical protein